jgi:hypothetical protein
MSFKSPANPITNPNPMYSHLIHDCYPVGFLELQGRLHNNHRLASVLVKIHT